MILIVGASGVLGRQIAAQLLARGSRLRLMSRKPEQLAAFAAAGAEVVYGDLLDAASLTQACDGASRVVAAAHGLLGRGRYHSEAVDARGHVALIDAAAAAGVQHFLYVSALHAAANHPVDFFRRKFAVEQHLKHSGLVYTILRPSAFMETHVQLLLGDALLRGETVRVLGDGSKPRNFIAASDVARFAVLALEDEVLRGRVLALGGPDNLGTQELVALYARIANLQPKVSYLPVPVARMLSYLLRPLHPGIARVLYMGSLTDSQFDERFDAGALRQEFALPLTTVEAFITERVRETDSRDEVPKSGPARR